MSWSDVRAAFERLLETPEGQRAARLAEIERADPALAAELRELLAHDERGAAFLERPPSTAPWAEPRAARGPTPQVGLRLGPYRLERPLGSGGMGTVWLAVRENPSRRVALKILASSSWSRDERWRFAYESEVLAGLAHAAIAQLYEAGSEERDGAELAWFAMELVEDARDVLTWAEERNAPRAERLALFGDLCDAVQYGHRRGVIHRDLKPANVLVGRDGRLKLIDFGVARAIEGSAATPSLRTRTGELVGTLQYMAPEQLAGRAEEIDARCDVYALGVILYRLLAGAPPFDFAGASLAEIARKVREEEPRRPSQVARELAGDLEWILLKALEKDPSRRYQGVAELAEDLRRFREHEPVLAHAPSALYRLAKFARRNRAQVAIALALLAGLAFAAFGLWTGLGKARAGEAAAKRSADEATHQSALALREAGRSREVLGLVEGLFDGIEDTVAGREVKVADLLDADVLAPGAIADPQVEFTVRAVRGKIYHRLNLFVKAREELERALAVLPAGERAPGERDREIETRALLGSALTRVGLAERGEAQMRSALDEARSAGLAQVQIRCLDLLLGYWIEKGAFQELLEGTEEMRRVAQQAGSENTLLTADQMLALALQGLGRDAEALPVLERLWKRQTERFGERDRRAFTAAFNYANSLQGAGRLDEAEVLYPQVLASSREVLGPSHNQTLTVLNNYAMLAVARGDRQSALLRMDETVRAYDASGLPPTAEHLLAINNLGMLRNQSGDFTGAEPVLRRAADLSRQMLAADDVSGILMRFNHGACLAWMKRWSEAEPILLEEYAKLLAALPADHPSLGKAVRTIADAYMVNGQPDEAARWRAR